MKRQGVVITFLAINMLTAATNAQPLDAEEKRGGQSHAAPQAAPHPAPAAVQHQLIHPQAVHAQSAHPVQHQAVQQVHAAPRTPSMSRSFQRPIQTVQHQHVQNIGAQANRVTQRNQIKQFIQQSKQKGTFQNAPRQRHQDVKGWLSQQNKKNQQSRNQLRNQINRSHPNHHDWFNDNFFSRHNFNPHFHHRGKDWWRGADWYVVNNWFGGGWDTPQYYDDQGYVDDIPPDVEGSAPYPVEPQVPAQMPMEAQDDWLPLGVFAAGKDAQQASYSNMFLQFAVNRQGDISGTYYNAATDSTYPIDGLIDRESQQAVWRLSDDPNAPLMTTKIYDLTQDVAPILVEFPDGTAQSWVLVRLNE